MKYLSYYISIFILVQLMLSCQLNKDNKASESIPQEVRIAFYNIENFFDTLDNPQKEDDVFTPTGENEWTTERWQNKANHIAQVIDSMDYPAIIGISEVETAQVMKDFIAQTSLSKEGYDFIHYESEDRRGIDCALLYKKAFFKVLKKDYIRMDFPDSIEPGYTSRDILHVQGKLLDEPVHLFINHWPSRYGGVEASEPKRLFVAQHLRDKVDEIVKKEKNPNIIIMGDMNDETDNKSLVDVLNAKAVGNNIDNESLYNCSAAMDRAGLGSYNYRGSWNMIDQIIVTGNLLNQHSDIQCQKLTIFKRDFMLYFDKKLKMKRPSRTYGGPRHFGGYSDHLPIFMDVEVR